VHYIDLNPVRARLTNDPARFPWSSCAALCGQRDDPLLGLHPTQLTMGTSDKDRPDAYRDFSAPTAATTSRRWSKPRRSALPRRVRPISQRESRLTRNK